MAKIESYSVEYEEGGQPLMTVLIRLDDRDPKDVVIEKIAASLPKGYQRSFSEGGLVPPRQGRSHPFEGPEMFDDEPKPDYDKWYDEIGARPAREAEPRGRLTRGPFAIDGVLYYQQGEVVRAVANAPENEAEIRSIAEDYPRLKELFEAKRAEATRTVAEGEGDWLLGNEDEVGKDD